MPAGVNEDHRRVDMSGCCKFGPPRLTWYDEANAHNKTRNRPPFLTFETLNTIVVTPDPHSSALDFQYVEHADNLKGCYYFYELAAARFNTHVTGTGGDLNQILMCKSKNNELLCIHPQFH